MCYSYRDGGLLFPPDLGFLRSLGSLILALLVLPYEPSDSDLRLLLSRDLKSEQSNHLDKLPKVIVLKGKRKLSIPFPLLADQVFFLILWNLYLQIFYN